MNAVSESPPPDSGTVPPTRIEPPADPLLGKTLDGRFVPRSLLGQGGMGRVYLAEDLRLKRRVALKLMDVALSADAEFAQRFKREAVVQAQASHPGIVQVLDAGECAEGAYMVLEYSEGRSLASLLKVGPLRRDRAMEFVEQLLDVLDFAHRQGIVHRDLKPGNILVEERGGREIVRVLDFGIAKLLQTERQDEGLTLTKPGFGFGTPGYMSLEQASGQPTDHRTDLYAAGVILYQMLGGALPHKAAGISDYLVKLASVDIQTLGARFPSLGIPPELDAILLKSLARSPDDRYSSALAFREALREFRRTDIGQGATAIVGKGTSPGVVAPTKKTGAGSRGPLAGAVIAAVAAGALSVHFWSEAKAAASAADDRVASARRDAGASAAEAETAREVFRGAGFEAPSLTAAAKALLSREAALRGEAAEADRTRSAAEAERATAVAERDEAKRRLEAADAAAAQVRELLTKAEAEARSLREGTGKPDPTLEGLRQDLVAIRGERDRLQQDLGRRDEALKAADAAAKAERERLEGELATAKAKASESDLPSAERATYEARISKLEQSLRAAGSGGAAAAGVWRLRIENAAGGAFDLRDATAYVADGGSERATALSELDGRILPGKSSVANVALTGPLLRIEGRLARMRPGSPVPGTPESLRRSDFSLKDGELVLTIK